MGRSTEDLLHDLVDLCEETAEHVRGVDLEDFLASKTLQRALERTLELIGEVANQLGQARPKINVPWDDIRDFRIMLAHAYHKIDPKIVYAAATHEVPKLLRELERAAAFKEKL